MALLKRTGLSLATAAAGFLALAVLGSEGSSALAQTASASGCDGVSVTPSSKTVRRGGRVLLTGQACGATYASGRSGDRVQVKLRKGKRWKTIGRAATDSSGEFEACVPVRVPSRTKVARLQVAAASDARMVKVRVSKKGSRECESSETESAPTKTAGGTSRGGSSSGGSSTGSPGGSSGGSASYTPPSDPPANPDCPLSQPGSTIGMTLPASCTVVSSDTASNPDPLPFWGRIDAQNASRHQVVGSGGDGHSTGTGASQGNSSFRRMTVFDGDNYYGERAELGLNDMNGPTAFYREGQRRVTFASLRLPSPTNPADSLWRTVLQMKQAQPYNNPAAAPIFELQARGGVWVVESNWVDLWAAPAQQNAWTRFAFDITYSKDPSVGSIKTYIDLNGDGDFSDANEQSPVIHTATLRAETIAGGYSPYQVGDSIPSHLRAGIYQNPSYGCPSGCSVDVDNVQVIRA